MKNLFLIATALFTSSSFALVGECKLYDENFVDSAMKSEEIRTSAISTNTPEKVAMWVEVAKSEAETELKKFKTLLDPANITDLKKCLDASRLNGLNLHILKFSNDNVDMLILNQTVVHIREK
jgi:hypothetical protein